MPITPTNLVSPVLFSLILWRAYARFRRNVGRQPLQPKRMVARIVLFGIATSVAAFVSLFSVKLMIGLGGGLVLGVPLALLGLHLTRFETTPEGSFYKPNTYIGVGLSTVFVGRLAYRMLILNTHTQALTSVPQPAAMQSPLTLFLFGVVASYYMAYYAGVMIRSHLPRS